MALQNLQLGRSRRVRRPEHFALNFRLRARPTSAGSEREAQRADAILAGNREVIAIAVMPHGTARSAQPAEIAAVEALSARHALTPLRTLHTFSYSVDMLFHSAELSYYVTLSQHGKLPPDGDLNSGERAHADQPPMEHQREDCPSNEPDDDHLHVARKRPRGVPHAGGPIASPADEYAHCPPYEKDAEQHHCIERPVRQ